MSIYSILTCCLNYIFDVIMISLFAHIECCINIIILVLLLFCFTICYAALLKLHVYFILTNYDVIHAIMINMMSDLPIFRNIS